MSAAIIDGKTFAATVRSWVADHVEAVAPHGQPGLAVVLVGDDPASQVYVKSKAKMTVEVGMKSVEHRLPTEISEADLLALIVELNRDTTVHGILVQLPLPGHLDEYLVINSIDPAKDVDGFHISNVGLLGTGQKSMVPCTPLGLPDAAARSLRQPFRARCRGDRSLEHCGQADGAAPAEGQLHGHNCAFAHSEHRRSREAR